MEGVSEQYVYDTMPWVCRAQEEGLLPADDGPGTTYYVLLTTHYSLLTALQRIATPLQEASSRLSRAPYQSLAPRAHSPRCPRAGTVVAAPPAAIKT